MYLGNIHSLFKYVSKLTEHCADDNMCPLAHTQRKCIFILLEYPVW